MSPEAIRSSSSKAPSRTRSACPASVSLAPLAVARHELVAERALQVLEHRADGGLRHAEFGRDAAQRSRGMDQFEQLQVLEAQLQQGSVHVHPRDRLETGNKGC